MTSSTNIIAKSEAAFEVFETIEGRRTDFYVTKIYDTIAKHVYPIRYDSVGSKHNLMGMIDVDATYTTK